MNRRNILGLAAATGLGSALLASRAMGEQTSLGEQILGTWVFVSSTAKLPDGSPLWGASPKGLMIFTKEGRYSWQIFRSDRPRLASKNRMQGTNEENAAILSGSLAYFGSYKVEDVERTIMTVVDGSTFPNSEGETLKRIVTRITPEMLVYENPATTRGEQVEAVWRRVA
jgi:hypothetical protein